MESQRHAGRRPLGAPSVRVLGKTRELGWKANAEGIVVSEVGEAIARRKVWIFAARTEVSPSQDWLMFSGQVQVFPMSMAAWSGSTTAEANL